MSVELLVFNCKPEGGGIYLMHSKKVGSVMKEQVCAIAMIGYRNASLNSCSNGAPASAHRMFFALDLMPVDEDVSRGELVRKVCAAHARDGRAHKTGLGFYTGTRFHVDSNGFRKWGPNGSGATSPCVTNA